MFVVRCMLVWLLLCVDLGARYGCLSFVIRCCISFLVGVVVGCCCRLLLVLVVVCRSLLVFVVC